MISNQKKKAVYKSALAVLLGCAMTGCGSKNEGNVTDNNTDSTVETDQDKDKDNAVTLTCENENAEVMSVEETNALTEGQIIKPEECFKIPNAEALEARELIYMYIYTMYYPSENGDIEMGHASSKNMRTTLIENNKIPEEKVDEEMEKNYRHKFEGIQIFKVVDYLEDNVETHSWRKVIIFNGERQTAGKVLTEEKIKELNGKQKTLQ